MSCVRCGGARTVWVLVVVVLLVLATAVLLAILARADQKPSSASFTRADQKPSGAKSTRAGQKPSGAKSTHTDWGPPGAKSTHADQEPPSAKSTHADQEPPGAKSTQTDQEPPGAKSTHADRGPPGAISTHADRGPPGAKSTHADWEPSGASSTREEEEPSETELPGDQEPPGAPRCHHPRCRYLHNETLDDDGRIYYEVEGNIINIRDVDSYLDIECDRANVLESPALPRYETTRPVRELYLSQCPLPCATSLQNTFETLNLTFCEEYSIEKPCALNLYKVPGTSLITNKFLASFERIEYLEIINERYHQVSIEDGFFMALKNLRRLALWGVTLPAELGELPPFLDELFLDETGMERVPESMYSSVELRKFTFVSYNLSLDAVAVPPGLHDLDIRSTATTIRLDAAPALVTLKLHSWVEPLPPSLVKCEVLREMYLLAPAMRALPINWLANCRRLETVVIEDAVNLITLPPQLFSIGSPLRTLVLRQGALETLPARVLDGLTHLKTLVLVNNRLEKIPSDFFAEQKYRLTEVNLGWNNLDGSVLDALVLLPFYSGITELDLSHNPRIGDVCDSDGNSPLWSFVSLRILDLSDTAVTRICRDWREDMQSLEVLNLVNTSISALWFADLQYDRKLEVEVRLWGAPIKSLRITREDFNKAKIAPPSFALVVADLELECDCSMYWARRGLGHPRAQLALPGISDVKCVGGGLLRKVPPEELVCEAQDKCAAAALPAGCECDSRPDDDSEQDRWLVRARCENSSLELVPRRMYPFYPVHNVNNQGVYLTKHHLS